MTTPVGTPTWVAGNQLVPVEPIYITDPRTGKFITPYQMSSAWVQFFQSLYTQTGGNTGSETINNITNITLNNAMAGANTAQQLNNLENYVMSMTKQKSYDQQIEELKGNGYDFSNQLANNAMGI
jgi:hypothetical protein